MKEKILALWKRYGTLLVVLRFMVPLALYISFLTHYSAVQLDELNWRISEMGMIIFSTLVNSVPMWSGMQATRSRGLLYDAAASILGAEIVLFVYYMQYQFMAGVLLVAIFLGGLAWMLTQGRKYLNNCDEWNYVPQNLMKDYTVSRWQQREECSLFPIGLRRYLVMASALLLLVPSLMVVGYYGMGETREVGQQHAVVAADQDNPLLDNLATIAKLREAQWVFLSGQEKIDVLQVVADMEAQHLGIEPVTVVNSCLKETVLGQYTHTGRQVEIDLKKHEEGIPLDCIETILHECRHAFQFDCVDTLDWTNPDVAEGLYYEQVRKWQEEFQTQQENQNEQSAWNQTSERDAGQYAAEGRAIYQMYIDVSVLPAR